MDRYLMRSLCVERDIFWNNSNNSSIRNTLKLTKQLHFHSQDNIRKDEFLTCCNQYTEWVYDVPLMWREMRLAWDQCQSARLYQHSHLFRCECWLRRTILQCVNFPTCGYLPALYCTTGAKGETAQRHHRARIHWSPSRVCHLTHSATRLELHRG